MAVMLACVVCGATLGEAGVIVRCFYCRHVVMCSAHISTYGTFDGALRPLCGTCGRWLRHEAEEQQQRIEQQRAADQSAAAAAMAANRAADHDVAARARALERPDVARLRAKHTRRLEAAERAARRLEYQQRERRALAQAAERRKAAEVDTRSRLPCPRPPCLEADAAWQQAIAPSRQRAGDDRHGALEYPDHPVLEALRDDSDDYYKAQVCWYAREPQAARRAG